MVRQDADTIPHGTTPGHKRVANGLTPQQMSFVAEVASGKTARDAAIAAGYKASNADNTASTLSKNPKVAAEIARVMAKATAVAQGSKAEALDMLWDSMVEAKAEQDRSGLKGLAELWLKANGHLIERREVRTDTVCEIEWSSTDGGGDDGS